MGGYGIREGLYRRWEDTEYEKDWIGDGRIRNMRRIVLEMGGYRI